MGAALRSFELLREPGGGELKRVTGSDTRGSKYVVFCSLFICLLIASLYFSRDLPLQFATRSLEPARTHDRREGKTSRYLLTIFNTLLSHLPPPFFAHKPQSFAYCMLIDLRGVRTSLRQDQPPSETDNAKANCHL